jgi:hypothetical protein
MQKRPRELRIQKATEGFDVVVIIEVKEDIGFLISARHHLNSLMIADLALCTPGIVKSLATITGQLN